MMSIKRCMPVVLGLAMVSTQLHAQVNPKEKLWQTLKAIQDNYVDSLSDDKLVNAAIAGMMKQLDPHSSYISAKEAAEMNTVMKGKFAGIGIQFLTENDGVYITQIINGGPAEKAGLQMSDKIVSIDQQPLTGLSNFDIMQKIRGEKGKVVAITVHRKSSTENITKEIVRDVVADKSVKSAYMVTDNIGYISLRIFSETTRTEMDTTIKELRAKGMTSLILDLQGNGGGYVEAAIGVADEFLPKDKLVFYSVGRDKVKNYYYTGGFGSFNEGNLVVLIDQSTASASEILTGSLQDWDRAVIVGRRSFGKGLMQHPVQLFDGSVLELTGARYYTPSGRSIQKPYHGSTYEDNVQTRLASGELMHADVFHFPDSLKYTTLVGKRTVYGGGGIFPDRFVPIDTVEYNGWLQDVSDRRLTSKPVYDYLDSNRDSLLHAYPGFNAFNKQYSIPGYLVQEVMADADKAGQPVSAQNKDHLTGLLALEMKAQLAARLYGNNDYYLQVTNTGNASFEAAMKLLENPAHLSSVLTPAGMQKEKTKQSTKKTGK